MCAAIISAVAELPVERELVELASFALDYGIHIATSVKNETFPPALITRDSAGGYGINQLLPMGLKVDNVFDFAREQLLNKLPRPAAAAIVMDGNVTRNGERFDAVIVRVGKAAADESHKFSQRYKRGGFRGRRLERVGNPGYAGSAPGLYA